MGRIVTLVLIDSGALLGALPPFAVPEPWWQEAADIVAGARERYGVELTVLRRLASERPHPPGGVSYLVEPSAPLSPPSARSLAPVPPPLAALALAPALERMPSAVPGGPAASLAWARAELLRCRTWTR